MLTVYVVYFDMENTCPDAYVLDEHIAKRLLRGNASGDYIMIELSAENWLIWLGKGK